MRWVLIDKHDNIVDTTELHSGYGKKAAKMYFGGRKRMEESSFDKLWKVMSDEEYESVFRATLQNKQYEWWKDDQSYLDIDKP